MSNETTIVFLHGAGTGAWVWERVMDELSIPSVALDIPGRVAGATPENCSEALVAELDRRGIDSIILVMHSLAGVLAPGLMARLGTRIKRCIFVAAVIPPSGGSFVDALGFVNRQILRALFKLNPKGLTPSPEMLRAELCNDLSPQDSEQIISRFTPEMPGLYLTSVNAFSPLPNATYIRLLKDKSVPPERQDTMLARLSQPSVRELETGHMAMLAAPKALTDLIMEEVEPAH
ncbi:MAG: alpha/beta hydrolase [Anaerolineae bacterium]|nr:alpha/beta hydrolase [Anaerolineae bacterium]